MNAEDAISILKEAVKKVPSLRSTCPFSKEHVQFLQSTGLEIERIFGGNSPVGQNFAGISYKASGPILGNPFNIYQVLEGQNQKHI